MFGDPFSNPGSMPNTLPGMSPRLSTTWTSRQRQAKGFNKNQILEVEGCRQRQIGLNIEKLSGKSDVPTKWPFLTQALLLFIPALADLKKYRITHPLFYA